MNKGLPVAQWICQCGAREMCSLKPACEPLITNSDRVIAQELDLWVAKVPRLSGAYEAIRRHVEANSKYEFAIAAQSTWHGILPLTRWEPK